MPSTWFSKFVSAEGGYFKPPDLTIEGSGQGYRFDSFLEPHLFYGAGKIGVPAGPVRFYFKAGFNYHRAESGTTQHIDEFSVTDENGVTTVTPARDDDRQCRHVRLGMAPRRRRRGVDRPAVRRLW